MPIYEYRCKKCEKNFELQQKMEERGTADCPSCGSSEVEKLFSVFGVGAVSDGGDGPAGCGPESCSCGKYGGNN